MKKILVITTLLLGFTLFSTTVFCQKFSANSTITKSVKGWAKFHAVITLLESKAIYKSGMSQDEFVTSNLAGVDDLNLSKIVTPYLQTIYSYHTKGLSADDVYSMTTGEEFATLENQLVAYEKSVGGSSSLSSKKPKWLNWLRKLIDLIDDNWP